MSLNATMRILHTNDFHGKLTAAKMQRLLELRRDADFYFDCGDAVKSGNIGISMGTDPIWANLAELRCTGGVTGNREFHITEHGFEAKIKGCKHPLLVANLRYKEPSGRHMQDFTPNVFSIDSSHPLPSGMVLGDVGVFGVMVPMVTDNMSARHISAYVNDNPIETAKKCVEWLKERVSKIICISHIGLRNDVELAGNVNGIDLILGGHSHDLVDPPARIGDTWIAQTGSHGRYAGVYDLSDDGLKAVYEPLP